MRPKKTDADRFRERFSVLYRAGKARANLNEEDVVEILGLGSRNTLRRKREDPRLFTLGEVRKLATVFWWEPEEVVGLINGGNKC